MDLAHILHTYIAHVKRNSTVQELGSYIAPSKPELLSNKGKFRFNKNLNWHIT